MQSQSGFENAIVRNADGSIDTRFYLQRARTERSRAAHALLGALVGALRAVRRRVETKAA